MTFRLWRCFKTNRVPQRCRGYLAVEGDFARVEGHQDVVDNYGDVVGGEEKHEQNL